MYRFDENGMTPSSDKLKALSECRAPATAAEVRSFLGLVNYIGQFIPDLATLTFPLREICKNKADFKWSESE